MKPNPVPHLAALVVAVLAAVAGVGVVVFGRLEPTAAGNVTQLATAIVGVAGGAHLLAIYAQGRALGTAAVPLVESIVAAVRAAVASPADAIDFRRLAEQLMPGVLRALPSIVAAHVSPTPAPPVTLTPDETPTVSALPVDTSPAAIARAKATMAAAVAAGLALVALALSLTGCSAAQRATETADLQRADVVCAALLQAHPPADVALACHLELPIATALLDGLAAYADVQAGTSPAADVSGAVLAAIDAGAQVRALPAPSDAGR